MKGNKPYLVVILIQAIYAAMFLLSKAAFDHGMNNFIFVFYRQIAATIFLIPFAFFFEWYAQNSLSHMDIYISNYPSSISFSQFFVIETRKTAPPLSFVAFCKIFFLSFLGYVQIFYISIEYYSVDAIMIRSYES